MKSLKRQKVESAVEQNLKKSSESDLANKIQKTGPGEKNEDEVSVTLDEHLFVKDIVPSSPNSIPDAILALEKNLSTKLSEIKFKAPIDYIYNPIEYAHDVHSNYVHTYCQGTKKILFLGMNPGPWGMSQNGVPFGEVSMAKEWLKMSGKIQKPPREHPERKITGFDCTRKEVSGLRFWGFFRDLCEKPENFFRHSYVHNYCPLAFMTSNARNITPADIKTEEQKKLLKICDDVLEEIFKLLKVEIVIGIGRFVEERAKIVMRNGKINIKVIYMAHPSPRALHNENWPEKAKATLEDQQLLEFFAK
ncbi:single-strand selective monofunctional uracil DNA glycosylase isoform X2 [Belonocnema kinseyi]|nr:single-strand selective monofunctional uracil DNA glycosylase isoform X2 [Belonocnema kinseyi]XP_033227421.1 single-strand selective monofunctional uracil DNA glycosylase isoform X2 [Belonocnema kinseyi]XP_033227422.1 single-strand selective monofunctional uracil DNA glycosylase isoform X2 [Belonocnema kinseyi]XP_033227423.1 single-strand selective monofunctional uracil DNA glycosylase isoform X2 [Belonocnema kinseyi]XP_033227424.1 single-strand selective monofunctional uracil DNA glycosylas